MAVDLFEKQAEIILDKHRFIGVFAGIQGAKTTTGALWSCLEMCKNGRRDDGIIIAPTYKIMNQSTLPKFMSIFPRSWGEYKAGQSLIELVDDEGHLTGAKIYIRSVENPDAIEGITAGWAWADEAPMMKAKAWLNLQGRLSIKHGRAFICGTPEKMGWTYHDFINLFKLGDPDYMVYEYESIANPYFPIDEFERMKRILAPAVFARRYQGQHRKMEGLIYEDFTDNHIVDPFQIPTDWDVFAGMDFGLNHYTAYILVARDHDENFYIFDEHYENKTVMAEHWAKISKMRAARMTWADPSAAQEILEMQTLGMKIMGGKNAVVPGLNKVTEYLRTGRLKVFKNCINTIDEFESYKWKEGKEAPEEVDDDLMDALRYCLFNYSGTYERPKNQTATKARLGSPRVSAGNDWKV